MIKSVVIVIFVINIVSGYDLRRKPIIYEQNVKSGQSVNECVIADLENGLEMFDYISPICQNLPKWIAGNYTAIGMESPDAASKAYISVETGMSCMSSTPFAPALGGTVEINVFMDGKARSDTLNVLVMSPRKENDIVVAMGTVFPEEQAPGWQSLKIELNQLSTELSTVYVILLGMKSAESRLLVDSFRFYPNTVDESACPIYKTDTTPKCVTYNFEQEFNLNFNRDNYLCNGFNTWSLGNYTSIGHEGPYKSTVYIKPNEDFSCISSSTFQMEPNGVVEATVFVEPKSDLDHIIVLGQKVTSGGYDMTVGSIIYYPEDNQFVPGWNVLSFTVNALRSFDGYLTLFGTSSQGSTVLIDSLRYIPPTLTTSDESCSIY